MTWLKRNLVLVVGGAIAIILLGAAGFFLFQGFSKNRAVSEELQQAAEEWKRLNTRTPSANEQNIEAAITEQKRLEAIVQEVRRHFAPFNTQTNIDIAEFKYLLANTIDDLERMAETYGVRRPSNFGYTFDNQRKEVSFQTRDLLPWAEQLLEIRALTEIIYRARVHSLLQIRRASSATNDTTSYVLRGLQPQTNHVARAVTTSYEVVFQGFTPELAAILDALAQSPHCFLVRNVNVERSNTPITSTEPDASAGGYAARYGLAAPAAPAPPTASSQEQLMMNRYGLRPGGPGGRPGGMDRSMAERYGIRPGGPAPPPAPGPTPWAGSAPARRGPETVLDEALLRFTVRLDAVRPLPLLAAK